MKTAVNIFTHYENHKGGVNNLQVSRIIKNGTTIKTFTSLKNSAHNRAINYLNMILK
jgi:hypothetical protein